MNLSDGTPCRDGNRCTTDGACSAGVCQLTGADGIDPDGVDDAPVKLAIRRFVLRKNGSSGLRLLAKASFTPSMMVEPDRSGMTVELDDATGRALYTATVPAEMFEANAPRTRFLYWPEGPTPAAYTGLKLLQVFTGGRNVVVIAKANVPSSVLESPLVTEPMSPDTGASALTLTFQWGSRCASNPVKCSGRKRCQPM